MTDPDDLWTWSGAEVVMTMKRADYVRLRLHFWNFKQNVKDLRVMQLKKGVLVELLLPWRDWLSPSYRLLLRRSVESIVGRKGLKVRFRLW